MITTTHNPETLTGGWQNVEEFIHDARLIAFDGCHKVYLAMDDAEAAWFREHYDTIVAGTPTEMLATLHEWFEGSCWLRFIEAVYRNEDDPNAGFVSLIRQGAQ